MPIPTSMTNPLLSSIHAVGDRSGSGRSVGWTRPFSSYLFLHNNIILGPQTPEDSIKFIRKKFDSVNYANPGKTIFMHETCATDSDQIQKIMESVISMIIQHNLKKSGLYWVYICFHFPFNFASNSPPPILRSSSIVISLIAMMLHLRMIWFNVYLSQFHAGSTLL